MRRLTVTTGHGDGDRAAAVAAAVRPDNTDRMETAVRGERVRTTVERGSTGGLQATADDYLVNLRAADRLTADTEPDGETETTATADADTDTNTNTDAKPDTDTENP